MPELLTEHNPVRHGAADGRWQLRRTMDAACGSGRPRQSFHRGRISSRRIRFRSQKNLFTIGFDPEFEDHIGLVDNPRNHTLLQTKLAELGHPECADQIHQSRTRPLVDRAAVLRTTRARASPRRTNSEPPAPRTARSPTTPAPRRKKSRRRAVSAKTISKTIPDPKGAGNFQRHKCEVRA